MLHPVPAVPVGEEGQGIGAMPGLDPLEVLRHLVQRRVPGDLLELLGPSGLPADHGLLQPIRVIEDPGSARAPGTEAPLGEGIFRVPLDLGDLPVLHMGQDSTLPKAELTEGGDNLLPLRSRIHRGVPVQAEPIGGDAAQGGGSGYAIGGRPDEFPSLHAGVLRSTIFNI